MLLEAVLGQFSGARMEMDSITLNIFNPNSSTLYKGNRILIIIKSLLLGPCFPKASHTIRESILIGV